MNKIHGMSRTPLYLVWICFKARCNNPKHEKYFRYGGRGIKICDEWSDFVTFKDWAIENGYSEGLLIDRIDNDGNYEPSNCRFIKPHKSSINRSTTKMSFTKANLLRSLFSTGKFTQTRLAELFGISPKTSSHIVRNIRWVI